MARNVQMQSAAVDILGFTVKQGLAHPLQVCYNPIVFHPCPVFSAVTQVSPCHSGIGNQSQSTFEQ